MTDIPSGAPPSRHQGSRIVNREPNIIRTVSTLRGTVDGIGSRVRREDMTFAPSDWTRGEPAISPTMANTHVTRVYRSGHAIFVDVSAGTGTDSVVAAQLYVPDLALTGAAITSAAGFDEQDLRLTLTFPEGWLMGQVRRVYVQARRVSGADATTMRVLRAWQR